MSELALIEEFKQVEDMMKFLNKPPDESAVVKNKFANNSEFLPISHIEKLLDQTFSGLWSVENFKYQVVVNELIGQLELKVFHPTAQITITRVGVAAKMIGQVKDSQIDDITAKIKNTLEKDAPALKAECIKNAAKSLGILFGRNLNRGSDGKDYKTFTEQTTPQTQVQINALQLLEDSNLNEKKKRAGKEKILFFTDEAITKQLVPYIIKNSTL